MTALAKPPLLIAEMANPEWSSVALVGWSHSRALHRLTGAHTVTQLRNAEAFARAGLPRDEYTIIDSEKFAAPANAIGEKLRGGAGKGWTTLMAMAPPSYMYFEHLLWKKFGPRIEAGEFSVVHRLTPLSPTTPSIIGPRCRKAGVPFLIGPLNGGVPWPKEFERERREEKEWLSYVRDAYRLLPGYRSTREAASAIICGSRYTEGAVEKKYRDKVFYIPENAIEPERFVAQRTRKASAKIRCVFVGRLVPYKGADIALEAAAPMLREGQLSFTLVGDGPTRPKLEALVAELGIGDAVNFTGNVPHREVQTHLSEADLFVFPSIREFGGGVLLEAMSVGLVPMAVDYAGPSELMTEATSFPIAIGSREELVARFRSKLAELVQNPGLIDEKSGKAFERARTKFTWEAKARDVIEVYRWALGERSDKPVFDYG